jgi:hypothetical protein
MWRLATSLAVLRTELDKAYPNRPKQSDGTIGDARHQAEPSDHNPNSNGIVCAFDITAFSESDRLAEVFRKMGSANDRVAYVIWNHRIASAHNSWEWVEYTRADPHTSHIHVSVIQDPKQYDKATPWPIASAPAPSAKPWYSRVLSVRSPLLSGSDVKHVQSRLHVTTDGLYGPNTASAVRAFQHSHGLAVDGMVGPQTAAKIG